MRKLQIILGIIGILLGCYTMVTAIMYLCGSITNLEFCMIGLAFCCVFNCFNCLITVLNVKKIKNNSKFQSCGEIESNRRFEFSSLKALSNLVKIDTV